MIYYLIPLLLIKISQYHPVIKILEIFINSFFFYSLLLQFYSYFLFYVLYYHLYYSFLYFCKRDYYCLNYIFYLRSVCLFIGHQIFFHRNSIKIYIYLIYFYIFYNYLMNLISYNVKRRLCMSKKSYFQYDNSNYF